jgi:hypothetical protein
MIAHAFMTASFLVSFQVIAFILNAPLLAYNVNKYALSLFRCFFPHPDLKLTSFPRQGRQPQPHV